MILEDFYKFKDVYDDYFQDSIWHFSFTLEPVETTTMEVQVFTGYINLVSAIVAAKEKALEFSNEYSIDVLWSVEANDITHGTFIYLDDAEGIESNDKHK